MSGSAASGKSADSALKVQTYRWSLKLGEARKSWGRSNPELRDVTSAGISWIKPKEIDDLMLTTRSREPSTSLSGAKPRDSQKQRERANDGMHETADRLRLTP
jgi:hypothetical protein